MVDLIKPTSCILHQTQVLQRLHVLDLGHKLRPGASEGGVATIVQDG